MNYKTLIIGPQLAGKTTLIKYLKKNFNYQCTEMDTEILKRCDNTWPKSHAYKDHVLVPEIIKSVLDMENIIFFASYIPPESITEFKDHGFIIILLKISPEEIFKRNEQRMREQHAKDASPWIPGELNEELEFEHEHMIDFEINAEQPTATVANEIINLAVYG